MDGYMFTKDSAMKNRVMAPFAEEAKIDFLCATVRLLAEAVSPPIGEVVESGWEELQDKIQAKVNELEAMP